MNSIFFKYLSVIAVVFLSFYYYEYYINQPSKVWQGVPKSLYDYRVFTNKAYMVGYSEEKRNPLWVSYKVIKTPLKSKYSKRPKKFKTDWRSYSRVEQLDYRGTGYDRGHLAPNYIIGNRYGKKAQYETFLMTNITPQTPLLNRKLWQRLEELVADYFSKNNADLWVITGPIFENYPKFLKNSKIEIPIAFFKILVQPKDKKVLAFIMPQKVNGRESLLEFVTNIDEIEEQTQLDFFHLLPDEEEKHLEALINHEFWNLKKVATKPPRY